MILRIAHRSFRVIFFKMNFIKDSNRVGTKTNKKANINISNEMRTI